VPCLVRCFRLDGADTEEVIDGVGCKQRRTSGTSWVRCTRCCAIFESMTFDNARSVQNLSRAFCARSPLTSPGERHNIKLLVWCRDWVSS
jgi:hypothetical protein